MIYPDYKDARPDAFKVGIEFQDFVCAQLAKEYIILQNLASKKYQYEIGENLQGFEIKYDERCTDTRRLSIEIAEKSRNDLSLEWTPSGIFRDDNTWLYIQGNYKRIYIFAKNTLRKYHDYHKPTIREFNGTIRRYFMEFPIAAKYAAKTIYLDGGE